MVVGVVRAVIRIFGGGHAQWTKHHPDTIFIVAMCTMAGGGETLGVGTPAAVAIGFGAIGVATAQVATNNSQTESDEIDLHGSGKRGLIWARYGWGVYPMYSRIAVIGETQERVDAYVAMYGGETMRKLQMEMPKAQKEAEN